MMIYVRRLLGLKERIHRDRAAEVFIVHCETEAKKLAVVLDTMLNERPELRPVLRHLLDLYCFALAVAAGLDAIYGNIDPPSQDRVMDWRIHELVVAKDVGAENVGHAPSPWPKSGLHIQYFPGTFEGGVASELQKLVRLYEELKTPSCRLVFLLVSVGAIAPVNGIEKEVYVDEEIAEGCFSRNIVGTETLGRPVTAWCEGLVVTDFGAALSELPKVLVDRMTSAIKCVDSFWPAFSLHHSLTW